MMSKVEREQVEELKKENEQLKKRAALDLAALRNEIEKLKKEKESLQSSLDYKNGTYARLENELDSAHSLLDGLPQAPARETPGEASYQRKTIQLTTRLASWIAKVAFSEAFANIGIQARP